MGVWVVTGAAVGFSQVGLLPMCEIPYAKYLDCGYDQFEEAAIAHWLSAGASPNGMVIRLQGFDRGVFGGNFHTHNTIHIPPGLDVRMHYSICMRKPVFLLAATLCAESHHFTPRQARDKHRESTQKHWIFPRSCAIATAGTMQGAGGIAWHRRQQGAS